MITFHKWKSLLFPNGEIFFVTGDMEEGILHLNIPEYYYEPLTAMLSVYDVSVVLNEQSQKEIIMQIGGLLKLPVNHIKILNSVNYSYIKDDITISSDNNAVYNREYDSNLLDDSPGTHSRIHGMFKDYPFSTAIIDNNRIVSFCGTYSGALCLETHPDYRGRGFATHCLELLISKLLKEKKYGKISFPTTLDNAASRRVAEKAGFTIEDRGIWIALRTKLDMLDPEFVASGIERVER